MTISEGEKNFELPGLESRVLPGGATIFARKSDLPFVERIISIGDNPRLLVVQPDSQVRLPEEGPLLQAKGPGDGFGGRV